MLVGVGYGTADAEGNFASLKQFVVNRLSINRTEANSAHRALQPDSRQHSGMSLIPYFMQVIWAGCKQISGKTLEA